MKKCNICGECEFKDFNGRKNVQCRRCHSLSRHRLLWLYLQKLDLNQQTKMLHVAPEKCLVKLIRKKILPSNYELADINVERVKKKSCNHKKIDFCDLDQEKSSNYDIIMHSHVLEHVFCNIAYTLFHLHRMLKENGKHIFLIPFCEGKYEESFQDMTKYERANRFGQHDHVRNFTIDDIQLHLGKLVNLPSNFNPVDDFGCEILDQCNIPEYFREGFHKSTVIILNKYDMVFLKNQ